MNVLLGLANSIWYRDNFNVESDFKSLMRNNFDADVTGLPFDDIAKDKINQWASDKTNGKIKKVLDEVTPDKIMFLLNALYFKGDWKTRFDSKKTIDKAFNFEKGGQKTVKMMYAESDFKIGSSEKYLAAELPYGNGQFDMTVIVPRDQNSIGEILDSFSQDEWNKLKSGLTKNAANIGLPRFTLEYSKLLDTTLVDMGGGRMYTGMAQFKKINKTAGLIVEFVKQDSFLSIDEKGTEAAAVTTIGMTLSSAGPGVTQIPQIICDRPFALIISEKTSNTILFMGRIMNPESK